MFSSYQLLFTFLLSFPHNNSHLLFICLNTILDRSLALILTYIRPCILYVWECPCIDCFRITITQFKKHFTIEKFLIKSLWLYSLENSLSQEIYLLDKFTSQIFIFHRLKRLKLFFFFNWANHCEAITVFEKMTN